MFALFHLAFMVIKISLLSVAYSAIIFLATHITCKATGKKRPAFVIFVITYFAIAGLLFVFSFTYYGNHGLGDTAVIPIGYGRTMYAGDGYAYFELEHYEQINVDRYLVRNNHLCFKSDTAYFHYVLTSGKLTSYKSENGYNAYALANSLPRAKEFKTFYPQYNEYWNGWRFWLLP